MLNRKFLNTHSCITVISRQTVDSSLESSVLWGIFSLKTWSKENIIRRNWLIDYIERWNSDETFLITMITMITIEILFDENNFDESMVDQDVFEETDDWDLWPSKSSMTSTTFSMRIFRLLMAWDTSLTCDTEASRTCAATSQYLAVATKNPAHPAYWSCTPAQHSVQMRSRCSIQRHRRETKQKKWFIAMLTIDTSVPIAQCAVNRHI